MTHVSDDLYLGNARLSPTVDPNSGATPGSPQGGFGVGPMGRVYLWDIVPAALGAAVIALAQTPAGAGNLVLTAGAGVTAVTNGRGERVLQLDVPRTVSLTGVAGTTAANFTITGYDRYGQRMSEVVAHAGGATVSATLKAFYQILSVATDAGTTDTISVGTTNVFGLPVRVTNVAYVINVKWDSTLAANAGTFLPADVTSPATTATGDVRGTYLPAGNAADGARRLVMLIGLPALASGPNATRVGAYGVDQNLAAQ